MKSQNEAAMGSSYAPRNSTWHMLQVLPLLALLMLLAPSAWSATYYVANTGNDASSGVSLSAPFKTVQKAMNTAVAGDTVYVRGGTYREEVSVYRGGGSAGKYVNLFAYNNEVPVLKGSDLVTGWVKHSGNIWKKTGWTINSQQVFAGYKDDHSLQQIGMPSRFHTSFHYPTVVGSGVSSMTAGSFYYEAGSSTLYVWLANGADPNTMPVEVSTRRRVLFMAMPYIHVKGFAFRHSNANAFGEQGSAVELSSYSIIENSDIQYMDFAGLSMGYLKTGALAVNCNVSNNGNSGINAAGSYDFRISNSKMNYNNTRNFNVLWHAGGFKGASKTYGTLEFNEVAHNNGSGIWFDYANGTKPIVINNNYIHDNGPKDAAIFFEVSKNGLIYNNVIVNNERRGIYLAASDNTRVYNNTVVGTREYAGIEVGGMPRSGATLTGNSVYNNIISNGSTRYDLTISKANGSSIANNTSNNNNFYRPNGAIQLNYGGMYTTLESWRTATNMDKASISANPGFVPPKTPATAFNYVPMPSSPVIDKGMSLNVVPHDYAMNMHIAGNAYDMGAFEATAAAPSSDKDITPPVVKMISPTQGAGVGGSVSIKASATDNVGVTSLALYVNGALKARSTNGDIAYTWDTKGLRLGSHSIWVSASDAAKNLSKQSITVRLGTSPTAPVPTPDTGSGSTSGSGSGTGSDSGSGAGTGSGSGSTPAPTPGTSPTRDTSPPVVTISPGQGSTVSGSVNISASASDNVKVTSLALYVDGALKARSSNGSIAYNWNTGGLRKGTHSIWVSAMDGSNNMGKQTITVKVQ